MTKVQLEMTVLRALGKQAKPVLVDELIAHAHGLIDFIALPYLYRLQDKRLARRLKGGFWRVTRRGQVVLVEEALKNDQAQTH